MSVTVQFRIRPAPSDWGLTLCVVGNTPALSSWGSSAPLPLFAMGGVLTRVVMLPADTAVEYKYVLVDGDRIVRWEQLPSPRTDDNRALHTGQQGDILIIDDGVFGNDETSSVRKIDSQEDSDEEDVPDVGDETSFVTVDEPDEQSEPEKEPALSPEDLREAAALADAVDCCRAQVAGFHTWLRTSRGLPPCPLIDEEAPFLASDGPSGTCVDVAYATKLVESCLDDGNKLVRKMHDFVEMKKIAEKRIIEQRIMQKERRRPAAHAFAVTSFAACGALMLALVIISPQLGREARRQVTHVGDVFRGAMNFREAEIPIADFEDAVKGGMVEFRQKKQWPSTGDAQRAAIQKRGWRDYLGTFWDAVRDKVKKARAQVCEKAGWPKMCGKMVVAKPVEANVIQLGKRGSLAVAALSEAAGRRGWQKTLAMLWLRVAYSLKRAGNVVCEEAGWPRFCGNRKAPVQNVVEMAVIRVARQEADTSDSWKDSIGKVGLQEAWNVFWKKVGDELEKAKETVCDRAGWPKVCGKKKMPVAKAIEAEVIGVTRGLRAWLEDSTRLVSGRWRPAPAETAWLWVPLPVRRLISKRS